MLKPKFLLADNLLKLAKYLRFLGYDASLYKAVSLDTKIRLCQKERRIYLTRAKKEAKSPHQFSRFWIREELVENQIRELSDYLKYDEKNIFTRCSLCNKLLKDIDKEKLKELIPAYVYSNNEQFRVCGKCGKIYWKGTHYFNLKEELSRLLLNK